MSTDDESSNNFSDTAKKFYTKTHKNVTLTSLAETVPIKLTFENARYTVKSGDKEKKILNSASGVFMPGQTYFILGGSGAGKSTLLNLITGNLNSQ
jgi:ABC-type multidrug transport system ATPase subunit